MSASHWSIRWEPGRLHERPTFPHRKPRRPESGPERAARLRALTTNTAPDRPLPRQTPGATP